MPSPKGTAYEASNVNPRTEIEHTAVVKSKPMDRKKIKEKRSDVTEDNDASHAVGKNPCSGELNSTDITCTESDEKVSHSSKRKSCVDDLPDADSPQCSNNASEVPHSDRICSYASSEIHASQLQMEERHAEFSAVPIDNATTAASDNHDPSSRMLNSPLTTSRRKLLILDLNGLLADIVLYFAKEFTPDTTISGKAVFKRPFCDDFLQFCFENFDVGVWSSRTRKNVDMVVSFLMGSSREKLLFCWDQSHCTVTGYNTMENNSKPLLLKELRKLWSKQGPDLPWEDGDYNETNTLLLDDTPYKALRNPPYTAIFPYPFEYQDIKDRSLGPGGNLRIYLERLAAADNVQAFVRDNPFGQRRITKTHLSWPFYAKIIGDDAYEQQNIIEASKSVQLQPWRHHAKNSWSSRPWNRFS